MNMNCIEYVFHCNQVKIVVLNRSNDEHVCAKNWFDLWNELDKHWKIDRFIFRLLIGEIFFIIMFRRNKFGIHKMWLVPIKPTYFWSHKFIMKMLHLTHVYSIIISCSIWSKQLKPIEIITQFDWNTSTTFYSIRHSFNNRLYSNNQNKTFIINYIAFRWNLFRIDRCSVVTMIVIL